MPAFLGNAIFHVFKYTKWTNVCVGALGTVWDVYISEVGNEGPFSLMRLLDTTSLLASINEGNKTPHVNLDQYNMNHLVVIWSIIVLNTCAVVVCCVSFPIMSWGTNGKFYNDYDEFQMVSDGFRSESAAATVIIGTCSLVIGMTRLLGATLIVTNIWILGMQIPLLIVCQMAGMATIR